ncbi:hypothetical protein LKO28_01070 [Sphingobacterium sp. FBM7-1]|nr:hypothetical protein [Sphingobacterium sp. FBM7-1]
MDRQLHRWQTIDFGPRQSRLCQQTGRPRAYYRKNRSQNVRSILE